MQRISVVYESCTCFTVLRKKNLYSHSCSTFVSDVEYDSRNAYRCDSITSGRIIQSTKRFKIFLGFSIATKMSGIAIRVRGTSSAYLAHPPSSSQPCEHNRSKEGFVCARWDSDSELVVLLQDFRRFTIVLVTKQSHRWSVLDNYNTFFLVSP